MKDRDLLFAASLPKCPQHLELSQVEAGNPELILGVLHGWQEPKHLSQHLLRTSRKVELKQSFHVALGLGMWHLKRGTQHLALLQCLKKSHTLLRKVLLVLILRIWKLEDQRP